VQRERGRNRRITLEHALVDHVARAVVTFFSGLEHESDRARYLAASAMEQSRRADEHRRVRVMATGVHAAVDCARVVEPRVLGHRQGVHIAAQQHHRSVSAFEIGNDRRHRVTRTHRQPQGFERIQHGRLRAGQHEPELRLAMDATAEIDDAGLQRLGVREQLRSGECAHNSDNNAPIDKADGPAPTFERRAGALDGDGVRDFSLPWGRPT